MFTPNVIEVPGSTPAYPPDSGVVRGGAADPVPVVLPSPRDSELGSHGTCDTDETGAW
jgi:hypothetical protein